MVKIFGVKSPTFGLGAAKEAIAKTKQQVGKTGELIQKHAYMGTAKTVVKEKVVISVKLRDELPIGVTVKTMKEPKSTNNYGKVQEYMDKEGVVVSYLPGNHMIRLRFKDGSIRAWMFEDVLVSPTDIQHIEEEREEFCPAKSSAGGTGLRKGDDPLDPPEKSSETDEKPTEIKDKKKAISSKPEHDDLTTALDPVVQAVRNGEWIEGKDATSGRPYWWNADSRETTWDLRKILVGPDGEPIRAQPRYYPRQLVIETEGEHSGVYGQTNTLVNDLPSWYNRANKFWLFSTVNHHWAITNKKSDFSLPENQLYTSTELLLSGVRHARKSPDEMHESWALEATQESRKVAISKSLADGSQFLLDTFYALHHPEGAGKVGVLIKKITDGSYTLQQVVDRLCINHKVDDHQWKGNPPRALVRHRITMYTKQMNISSSTWNQLEVVVGRCTSPQLLDAEMIKLCNMTNGNPEQWIGDYPEALRPPILSEDYVRCRIDCLNAIHGNNSTEVDADNVIERVIEGGENFKGVLFQQCNTLGVDPTEWIAEVPVPLVEWIINQFLQTFDPNGRGGETKPVALDITAGKYTLDDVLTRMCDRWFDKGANKSDWVGDYPSAMKSFYKNGETGVAVLKETKSLRNAIDDARFKFRAFAMLNELPQGTHPIEHLENRIRRTTTVNELTACVNGIMEDYFDRAEVPRSLRYLWRGDDPPALLRYRLDELLQAHHKSSSHAHMRDTLLQQILSGKVQRDDAIEFICQEIDANPIRWKGAFPLALRVKTVPRDDFPELPEEPHMQEAIVSDREPEVKFAEAATSLLTPEEVSIANKSIASNVHLTKEPVNSILVDRRVDSSDSDSDNFPKHSFVKLPPVPPKEPFMDGNENSTFAKFSNPSVGESIFDKENVDPLPSPNFFGASDSPTRSQLMSRAQVSPGHVDPNIAKFSLSEADLASMRGTGSSNAAVVDERFLAFCTFKLVVFHRLHHLPHDEIPAMVSTISSSGKSTIVCDNIFRQLCANVSSSGAVPALWVGPKPPELVKYCLESFFSRYHVKSLPAVMPFVDLICGSDVSLDKAMHVLCMAHGVNPSLWTGPFPHELKRPRVGTPNRTYNPQFDPYQRLQQEVEPFLRPEQQLPGLPTHLL